MTMEIIFELSLLKSVMVKVVKESGGFTIKETNLKEEWKCFELEC